MKTTTTVIAALAVMLMAFPCKQATAYPVKKAGYHNIDSYFPKIPVYAPPPSSEYGCLDNINISLNQNCAALIIPATLITGNLDNVDAYNIMVDGQNTAVLSGCGEHTYSIEVIENGLVVFNCGGNIFAEDKSNPFISCPPDISEVTVALSPNNLLTFDLMCNDIDQLQINGQETYGVNADGTIIAGSLSDHLKRILDLTGYPDITDNCGPVAVVITDEVDENGDCGEATLVRTFYIADRADGQCVGDARTNDCPQIIHFRKPNLADVQLPDLSVTLECNELFPPDGDVGGPDDNPSSAATGFPFIQTAFGNYNISNAYCNIGASYSDETRIIICEGTYEIRREWNLIDWCVPGSSFSYDQFIQVGDFTSPAILLDIPDYDHDGHPDDTLYYTTSPFNCAAIFPVPFADIDNIGGCSSIAGSFVTITDMGGSFVWMGTEGTPVSLAIGSYILRYCVEDACGNESCEEWPLNIGDDIAPTASCNDELIVAIGGGDIYEGITGIAHVLAEDINEGSSDNCSALNIDVRRNYWLNNTCHPNENRWSPWADGTDFYCCDIGREITLELRVTDTSGNWNVCWTTITPEDKLVPYCYAPPAVALSCLELPLTFPTNIAVAYNDDFKAASEMMNNLFGAAWGTDNCALDTVVERTPLLNINDCGWGTITRYFEAWQLMPAGDLNNNGYIDRDEVWVSSNSCTQLITITETHDYRIDFPQDASAACSTPCIWGISTAAEGCDVLVVNRGEPVRFSATGDECYKLSITYDVINWCLWDGEYEGYEIPRMTEDDDEDLPLDKAVESTERPVITGNDAGVHLLRNHLRRTVCMDGSGGYTPDDDSSLSPVSNMEEADLNRGRWRYTQFVKVFDATVPVLHLGDFGGPTALCPTLEFGQFGDPYGMCEVSVEIPFTITDDCELFNSEGELVVVLESAEIDFFAIDSNFDGLIDGNELDTEADIASNIMQNGDGSYLITGEYPILNPILAKNAFHAIQLVFEDGCGNQLSQIIQFGVVDCKPPSPICINGLTITLMPQAGGGCANTIWAADFEASPIYDCTGQGPDIDPVTGLARITDYAIYRASEVEGTDNFTPSLQQTALELNEADIGETVIVYVYAFDGTENYDYCETYINVEAHQACGLDMAVLSGLITTEENEGMEGVEVNASNSSMTNTTPGGAYLLNLPIGGDYTITPYLNTDPLNGVTTFDIILISKHILGVQILNSPYKIIAADANRSNTITTLDLIQIRKLILNIITEFPDNNSWRFVEAAYDFPEQENPWSEAFPELINQNNLGINIDPTINEADFIGIKTGDVNASAQVNVQGNTGR